MSPIERVLSMNIVDLTRKDTLDLEPAEFIKMKEESPEKIKSVQFLLPPLGSAEGFGKIRITLSTPRYDVNL
jgi:hypothetical protein